MKKKSLAPLGNRTAIIQPVTRRYTDWATPAPLFTEKREEAEGSVASLLQQLHKAEVWYLSRGLTLTRLYELETELRLLYTSSRTKCLENEE
jgi:hypothetical protein